jgi:hypothetical protein
MPQPKKNSKLNNKKLMKHLNKQITPNLPKKLKLKVLQETQLPIEQKLIKVKKKMTMPKLPRPKHKMNTIKLYS